MLSRQQQPDEDAPANPPHPLRSPVTPSLADFTEPDARRVLLVRAIETTDPRGKLLAEAERTQASKLCCRA